MWWCCRARWAIRCIHYSEDLANIACHLLSEAFMRTVIVNIDMVKDALNEYEDEEGETE